MATENIDVQNNAPDVLLSKKRQKWKVGLIICASIFFALTCLIIYHSLIKSNFIVSNLQFPEQVMSGKNFVVSVDIENTGIITGEHKVNLVLNNLLYRQKLVELKGRSKTTVKFDVIGDFSGEDYHISVEELNGVIKNLKPAEFETSEFRLSPNTIRLGEDSSLTLKVSNVGDMKGTYSCSLSVDDDVYQKKEVTLEGESSTIVSFIISPSKSGKISISLDDYSDILNVTEITRPANGYIFYNVFNDYRFIENHGQLNIENGLDQDAVVILVSADDVYSSRVAIYIRAHDNYTISKIVDGTYKIYYSTGKNFEKTSQKFTTDARYGCFDDNAVFHTKFGSYSLYGQTYTYSSISITLQPVVGGNATTSQVSPDDFPSVNKRSLF